MQALKSPDNNGGVMYENLSNSKMVSFTVYVSDNNSLYVYVQSAVLEEQPHKFSQTFSLALHSTTEFFVFQQSFY